MNQLLKIGEVARRAGVRVDTVRYYERCGIVPPAERRASGYRAFTPGTVERIRLTKQLQALGFSLDHVRVLLGSLDTGAATCASEKKHIAAALARVDQQIAALKVVRRNLASAVNACDTGACRLLDGVVRASP